MGRPPTGAVDQSQVRQPPSIVKPMITIREFFRRSPSEIQVNNNTWS